MANLNWKERLIMEIHYVNMASWLLIVLLTCMLYKCILHMYIIMYHDIITEEKEREHVYKTLTFSRSFLCTYILFSKPTLTFHCYAKKNNYTLMLSLSPPKFWCKWWGFENNDTWRVIIRKFYSRPAVEFDMSESLFFPICINQRVNLFSIYQYVKHL